MVQLLALLYSIQLLTWETYEKLRMFLATQGLVYPNKEDLNNSIARNMISPFQCSVSGFEYPQMVDLSVSNLVCPKSPLENIATEINPNNASVWNVKGVSLFLLGKDEGAIRCLGKAIELKTNDAGAWYYRACSKVKKLILKTL